MSVRFNAVLSDDLNREHDRTAKESETNISEREMHTIQFEPAIERQLDRIATRTGKNVDQRIEKLLCIF